jgi:hypothetical protein
MARQNTKATQPATKPASKASNKPAAKPARPANTVSVQDLAEQLDTTPKALRQRIRGMKDGPARVGKGGTYSFTHAQAQKIVKQLAGKA